MPEADAVRRTAIRLDKALTGKRITDWELRWPSLATSDHRGATTLEVVSRGKHLLHRLDDGYTLHSHLRMDGAWRVKPPAEVTRGDLANRRLRALVGARDATCFGWELGMLDVVPTNREHVLVGHLGPELIGANWDPDVAVANLQRRPEVAIGTALLDQRNLAGIGTIWMSESLFLQRIWPWTPVGELSAERLWALVQSAHLLILAALPHPWSVSTGDVHRPTYVHSREERACRQCATRIRMRMVPGGSGLLAADRQCCYCPRCQAPSGPTVFDPPQRPDRSRSQGRSGGRSPGTG